MKRTGCGFSLRVCRIGRARPRGEFAKRGLAGGKTRTTLGHSRLEVEYPPVGGGTSLAAFRVMQTPGVHTNDPLRFPKNAAGRLNGYNFWPDLLFLLIELLRLFHLFAQLIVFLIQHIA